MKNLGNIVSHQAPMACVALEEKYHTKCEDAKKPSAKNFSIIDVRGLLAESVKD